MNELISRFTEAEKHFIDGITNLFCYGIYPSNDYEDVIDVSQLSTKTLFSLFDFCVQRMIDVPGLQMEITRRHDRMIACDSDFEPDELYDDLYGKLFNEYEDFFIDLKKHN
jgi:hypothetical protein